MTTISVKPSPGRRAAMRALAGGAMLVAGRAWAQRDDVATRPPSCVLTPQQTEGPYFVDERLERADIRSDPSNGAVRAGVPLALSMRISTLTGSRCEPLSGAIVDVWHCDAAGIYSDVDDASLRTRGSAFLRGYQVTDTHGQVRFTTIYPGAYRGRAVHIHFKVRTKTGGRAAEFTSQRTMGPSSPSYSVATDAASASSNAPTTMRSGFMKSRTARPSARNSGFET